MSILVTGGAGFIGGNFVHYMLREHPEDEILCVDALTYAGNMETLAPVMGNPHFKFIKADIADREAIYGIFEQEKPDVIVLDPPRDGIHPKALPKILNYGVERIVYISCKMTSLARDLEMMQIAGYRVEKMTAVDQFCETVHCETVALLTRTVV